MLYQWGLRARVRSAYDAENDSKRLWSEVIGNGRLTQTAILYDALQVPGGAESVALLLSQTLPDAKLCVGSVSKGFDHQLNHADQITSLGGEVNHAALRAWSMIRRFERCSGWWQQANHLVLSGSYAPVAAHRCEGRKFNP